MSYGDGQEAGDATGIADVGEHSGSADERWGEKNESNNDKHGLTNVASSYPMMKSFTLKSETWMPSSVMVPCS